MAKYYGHGYIKEICSQIKSIGERYSTWRVFEDFLELSAISISNQVDLLHREKREARYMEIVKQYSKDEINIFPELFGNLVLALEAEGRPYDVLGKVFHLLELHNKYHGQFFTPQHIADMIALCTNGEDIPALGEKGYITVLEPCCGSGVLILGMAHALDKNKLNHSENMLVTAIDIDLKCVMMCYLQCALWGIPAVVIHGDSLTMKEWDRWYTPMYMLGGWVWRQHCGITDKNDGTDEAIKQATEPVYAAIKNIEALSPDIAKATTEKLDILKKEETHFDINLREVKNGQLSLF
jgi:hypothetical protein